MLIENYKGIEIFHNASSDIFYTTIVIRKGTNGRKDEFLSFPRLQKTRDEIDKFLNTSAKKPILKKAWYKGKYDSDGYKLVEVVVYSDISQTVTIKGKDVREEKIDLKDEYYNNIKLFLHCKENDAIISNLIKKKSEIDKINKEISCSGGKLLPLKLEHFK